MANTKRKKNGQGAKRPPLKYFFLEGDLHIKLNINRGKDLLTAWNYPSGKKVTYHYTDALRRMEKAFTTKEVGELVNRSRVSIEMAVLGGHIHEPQYTYALNENRNKYKWMWREKDIMELHEYLSGIHWGRPRKDGLVTPKALPTPRELRAMIHDEAILYVKDGDTFIPSWRAKNL